MAASLFVCSLRTGVGFWRKSENRQRTVHITVRFCVKNRKNTQFSAIEEMFTLETTYGKVLQ